MRCYGDRGQDLVEFALIFPVLMLLLLGIMEFAVLVWSYDTIANAAREGARLGIIRTATTAQVEAAVVDRALALGLTDANVEITIWTDTRVQVEVVYEVPLFTGLIADALGGSPTIPMRTVATMRRE
jgi:Flp pilus assembly protein TadG